MQSNFALRFSEILPRSW